MPRIYGSAIVGRDEELEALLDCLSQIMDENGLFVLVSGEAGIGKTCLCEEFERLATRIGCKELVGYCIPGPAVPFLPVVEAVHGIMGKAMDRYACRTSIGGEEQVDTRSESERMMFSILEALRVESSKAPVIMRVEDLHWADPSSLQLLLFLARSMRGLRLLVVGTYRPEELVGEGEGAHPLVEWMEALGRQGCCQEIGLKPLGREALVSAVGRLFGGAIDRKVMAKVAAESGGNPLFAIEMLRYLSDQGSLVDSGGTLVLRDGTPMDLPGTIRELLLRRVDRLPKDHLRVLELASVMVEPVMAPALERIRPVPGGATAQILEDLRLKHRMLERFEGGYAFSHESIRRTTYEQMSRARRKELHRLVGDFLERRLPAEAHYGELAFHFERAEEKGKTLKYSLLAGESCLRSMAMSESLPFFQKVVEEAGEGEKYHRCRLRALEGLGTAHLELSNYASSADCFDRLLALSPEPRMRARALRKKAECYGPTRLGKGSSEALLHLVEEAERIPEIEAAEMGEIWHYRAMVTTWEGRPEEASMYAKESERVFRESGPIERLAIQLTYNLTIDITIGDVGLAIDKAREIWDLYREHPFPSGELELLNYLGIALIHQGRDQEAMVTLQRSVQLAERLGDYPLVCWGYIYQALAYESLGNLERAVDMGIEAREQANRTESPYMTASADSSLARHLLALGRVDEAAVLVEEAGRLMQDFKWTIKTPARGLIELARAQLCSARGGPEADAHFEGARSHLHGAAFSLFLEGCALQMHGESLMERGEAAWASERLAMAEGIFTRIGNEGRAESMRSALGSLQRLDGSPGKGDAPR